MIITPVLVIFMLIVFVVLFLFLNTIDRRKWLTLIISIVLTPFVYFYLFYPFLNIISNYHHLKYFNSDDWADKPALRYEMVDNLISSDTLIGMSQSEIKQSLGEFEWLSWNETLKVHDSSVWNYGLGIEPGAFNTNKECLEIRFKNNKVVDILLYKEKITYETATE